MQLIPITSKGDKILEVPLSKIGGKGLFVKELQSALLNDKADIAVHSMKDVPMVLPDELQICCICEREDPRDAFVSNRFKSIDELPPGAVVGTSSLRRQSQILSLRPDLTIKFLRGNVNTRLKRMDDGNYDAIILAAAGLIRLDLRFRIQSFIDTKYSLPSGGQGAVGIEVLKNNQSIKNLLQFLNHKPTAICVESERALNKSLNGGCEVPIASYAELKDNKVHLKALVGSIDGKTIIRSEGYSDYCLSEAEQLGCLIAKNLREKGAQDILNKIYK